MTCSLRQVCPSTSELNSSDYVTDYHESQDDYDSFDFIFNPKIDYGNNFPIEIFENESDSMGSDFELYSSSSDYSNDNHDDEVEEEMVEDDEGETNDTNSQNYKQEKKNTSESEKS